MLDCLFFSGVSDGCRQGIGRLSWQRDGRLRAEALPGRGRVVDRQEQNEDTMMLVNPRSREGEGSSCLLPGLPDSSRRAVCVRVCVFFWSSEL